MDRADDACHWGMKYQIVIGFGKAIIVEDFEEKQKALAVIMSQYSDRTFEFPEKLLKQTAVIEVEIESMTGKQSGF